MPATYAHDELVKLAKNWLHNQGCGIAFAEPRPMNCYEHPDAIGWKGGYSILVECKISIEDFFSDKSKMARKLPTRGMGYYRWYMAPKGLIRPDLLLPNWGLLEVKNGLCYKTVRAEHQPRNDLAEIQLLASKCSCLLEGRRLNNA